MVTAEKFIVMPFKKTRAGIIPTEMRQASNAASAERIAASMASRFVGVVALSAIADTESGDLTGARLLASYGETADLSSMVEFASDDEAEPEPVAEAMPTETPNGDIDKIETAKPAPDPAPPLIPEASSLILTAPPEPTRVKRGAHALVKRLRPPAPSAGPLFEQIFHA